MSTTAGIEQTGSTTSSISISYGATTTTPPISSWSVSGPSGVIASGGGTSSVSGSATVSGLSAGTSYSFSMTATSVSGTSSPSYSFSTQANPVYPPSWSDNTLGGFQVGVAYSDGVSATNSPTYSVSVGLLPAGISLNTGSGAVTGTPTTAGSYSFTLQASNVDGSVTAAFSGTVAAAPTAGKLKVYNGSSWVYGPVKVYNGTAWVDGSVKVWNGTAWVTSV